MPNTLCIAGAGSGKTRKIIAESISEIDRGGKVLVVTYTINNQHELRNRFLQAYGKSSDRFVVKGIFSFYLEDMVRPYQQALFKNRINEIFFNERNPHLQENSKFFIPGRAEYLDNSSFNPRHFLTLCETKAHSGYLAKLAVRIAKATQNAAADRLGEIYSHVYFDEVQDLVGWDYDVLKILNKRAKPTITCVGDFRQTVYDTAFGQKAPLTAVEKISAFKAMRFVEQELTQNWRSIQTICNIADSVHLGSYGKTDSAVVDVPPEFAHHVGAFTVRESQVTDYIEAYNPTVLRWQVASGAKILPPHVRCYNFGSSKGLGFDRVLILPAESQMQFVLNGAVPFPSNASIAQNKMYVAITRARYSIAFIVPDKKASAARFVIWDQSSLGRAELNA